MGGGLSCTDIGAIVKGFADELDDEPGAHAGRKTRASFIRANLQRNDEQQEQGRVPFRRRLRAELGLPEPDQIREQQLRVKLMEVLEHCKEHAHDKDGQLRKKTKGDPLEVCREGGFLEQRVSIALSTTLQLQHTKEFVVKKGYVVGTLTPESAADEFFACIRSERGRIPTWNRPNQDEAFYCLTTDGYRFCGMFDGHGADGHRVADVVRDFVFRRLLAQIPVNRPEDTEEYKKTIKEIMSSALTDAEAALFSGKEGADCRQSGATAAIFVYDKTRKWLFSASVGNCRCVLGEFQDDDQGSEKEDMRSKASSASGSSKGKSSKASSRRRRREAAKRFCALRFTKDHMLSDAGERVRITMNGGLVIPGSMGYDQISTAKSAFPALPVTRCLGNLVAKRLGVVCQPEVNDRSQDEYTTERSSKIRFVVLATDGLWHVMSDQKVVDLIKDIDKYNVQYAVSSVIQSARAQWELQQEKLADFVDDITVCIFWL
eukprot:TRINITY_DN20041_c0_g1_i2.p1 TRINITY_DN20041_c0_g1~~TRINITY_DN20041_c0_g1_i2.p1  ORF type:complete len:489 (-),score=92.30 TRINITY_DN20041_c0_g1_i2:229-1695(-)